MVLPVRRGTLSQDAPSPSQFGLAAFPIWPRGTLSQDAPPHFFASGRFPLKWAIFNTTPFVLHKSQEHKYIRCAVVAALWLAILAFLMTECVEYLGCAIAIEPTAM